MDSLIAAAARALAGGDVLAALAHVALRDDPPALALRGIAMAQLGELVRARDLLRAAWRGFGEHERLARARCVVAEAEVALALRDIDVATPGLDAATRCLVEHGDHGNALQARLIGVRRLLLLGRLSDAALALQACQGLPSPAARPSDAGPLTGLLTGSLSDTRAAALSAVADLATAELALRRLDTRLARNALERARMAARHAGVAALQGEVDDAHAALSRPAARLRQPAGERLLTLDDVHALLEGHCLVLDGCRRGLRQGGHWLPLLRRPVLFTLARALAQAWPGEADRAGLIAEAFRMRHPDETHRARLRVEIGRLRALVAPLARIEATPRGFRLAPHDGREVAVLLPPIDGEQASLLALLADGAAWSTSSLALALDSSQRTLQRALAELEADGQVRSIGRGRNRRWLAPTLTGFTTILLLPASLAPA